MSPHASHTLCAALESYVLQVLHASRTWCAAHELDFACCTRVRPCVLHASQTSCAARESLYVAILRTYHSKLNTKHANESK